MTVLEHAQSRSTPQRLSVEIAASWSQLEEISTFWDVLHSSSATAGVFTSFTWARACWRAFQRDFQLCTPVVYRGSDVVGILPLVAQGNELRFLGAPRSDYNDVICSPSDVPHVVAEAFRGLKKVGIEWKRCELENLPDDSAIVSAVHCGQLSGGPFYSRLCATAKCPRVIIDSPDVLAGILRKKSLRRHEKKLSKLGNVQFRHLTSRAEINQHLPTFYRQHIARRAMAGDESLFSSENNREFYRFLVEEFDPSKELRFGVLEVDGKAVAYHFGFQTNGTLTWYKPTFDVDMFDYSPGEVLIRNLLEYMDERGLQEFDFTVGDEPFKLRFANSVRTNHTLYLYPRSPSGATRRIALGAREVVKKKPRLFTAIQNTVTQLSKVRRALLTALHKHGATKLAGKCVGRAMDCIYRRDEVLVYFCAYKPGAEDMGEKGLPKLGTLEELACLAATCPEFITESKLRKARQRLKDGDSLFFLGLDGKYTHLAWTGLRQEITAKSEVGQRCRVTLESPGLLIYDCFTPEELRGRGLYPTMLRALVRRSNEEGYSTWIYCRSDNSASKRGIEKSGFQLRYRLRRVRCFGCISSHSVDHVGHIE